MLTNDQTRRIEQAITETRRLLAKEQNHAAIIFYRSHIAKLEGYLSTETLPPVWNAESARRRVGGTFGT